MLSDLTLLAVLVVFAGAVYGILRSQDKRGSRELQHGEINVPEQMIADLVDEIELGRLHAGRLRLGMQKLIDHWPGHFRPEELAEAQALIDEAAGVGL
ncbi:hypothetical protein [Geothrix campi]|uniref:hypothetical protein n=1 Tax=Geothrix campi TaxID=2966450 RepID=UPI0021482670|nr:hypothetical protein [Geothrix sp. SG10]